MGAGFYLHRQNYVTPQGKTMLALIAQQVTIPAFLFAKIIFCPSDHGDGSGGGSDAPEFVCPSVADRIGDLWMLLLWPFFVVPCGLLTGYLAARISDTPPRQVRSCLAACAFPNSTGLAITLLSVIHKQFSSSAELGRVDPTAFLSVYLLLYPVLQWGLGGWLLAPPEHADDEEIEIPDDVKIGVLSIDGGVGNNGTMETSSLLPRPDSTNSEGAESGFQRSLGNSFRISHILNYESNHQSATAAAEQEIFGSVMPSKRRTSGQNRWNTAGYNDCPPPSVLQSMVKELSFSSLGHLGVYEQSQPDLGLLPDQTHLLPEPESFESIDGPPTIDAVGEESSTFVDFNCSSREYESTTKLTKQQIRAMQRGDILPLTDTLLRISGKVFQPPVTAAVLGLFIASFHNLRGMFVNIYGDKGKRAPLQFLFDGIYTVCSCGLCGCFTSNDLIFSQFFSQVGQSAVPINMIILGINLSSTFQKKSKRVVGKDDADLSNKTMFALVVAKMIVMPIIGILSTWFLEHNYTPFPDGEYWTSLHITTWI